MSAFGEEEESHTRLAAIEQRLTALESKLAALATANSSEVAKVKQSLLNNKVFNYRLVTVPEDYYDRSFQGRADILSASIPQLCKSLIFENANFDESCQEGADDLSYAKFYLVVVQYEAKFDTIRFENLIWGLRPYQNRLAKSKFNFNLASAEDNDRLSGYKHNAVTPFGMTTERSKDGVVVESGLRIKNVPVVICSRLQNIRPSYIYLGGGEVNVKLGLGLSDFIRVHQPIIGNVSEGREL
jgi:hypothetical protein